jgi:hypothetical protein
MPSRCVTLDLSIFRARPGSGRAEKNSVISGRNNPAHDHPTGRIRPQFSGRARAGPGLGRAARVFYSVKQIKTTFRAGHGPKKIRGLQDLCPRPSSKVRGRAWRGPGRAGLKMLRYMSRRPCHRYTHAEAPRCPAVRAPHPCSLCVTPVGPW